MVEFSQNCPYNSDKGRKKHTKCIHDSHVLQCLAVAVAVSVSVSVTFAVAVVVAVAGSVL